MASYPYSAVTSNIKMGLFNFSKSSIKKNQITEDPFALNLSQLLEKSVFIKRIYDENGNFVANEYDVEIDNLILKVFDTVRIALGWPEKEIKNDPSHSIMVTLLSKKQKLSFKQAEYIVNTIAKMCNVTDDNWTSVDEMRLSQGPWRGRMFTSLKGNTIFIDYNDHVGFNLCILGYEKLL